MDTPISPIVSAEPELVAVTGGTGHIAGFLILALLERGYRVRASVRSPEKEADLREALRRGGGNGDAVEVVVADLSADAGWAELVAGASYVHHVASPFELALPRDPRGLIDLATEGTLRVLRASRDAGVRRVVLTSSVAAIAYGHRLTRGTRSSPFTERDWTFLDGADVNAYIASKAVAERSAWEFMASEGAPMEMTAVNPVAVFGPVLSGHVSSSVRVIQTMLTGRLRFWPDISTNIVDVRDVADLHVAAMTSPEAAGERFIAASGEPWSFLELDRFVVERSRRGPAKRTGLIPDRLVRLGGRLIPSFRAVAGILGRRKFFSAEKASRVLGFAPRSAEETISECVESLEAFRRL